MSISAFDAFSPCGRGEVLNDNCSWEPTPSAPSLCGSTTSAAAAEDADWPAPPRCPLSSSCTFTGNVLDHLMAEHAVPQYDVEIGKDGAGAVETQAMVWLKQRRRYSAMLLHYNNAVFLWSMETRSRADAETQVSAVMQLVQGGDGSEPPPPQVWTSMDAKTEPSSPSSSSAVSPSSRGFRVSLSVGWPNNKQQQQEQQQQQQQQQDNQSISGSSIASAMQTPVVAEADQSATSASMYKHKNEDVVMVDVTSPSRPRPWITELIESPLGPQDPVCHESLVSHGQGVVVLWPTQSDLFQPAADGSPNDHVAHIHISTRIEQL